MFNGIKKLLMSAKGTLCLIILGLSFYGLLKGHLDGLPFAGIISTIGTIYCWTQHKTDIANQQYNISDPNCNTPINVDTAGQTVTAAPVQPIVSTVVNDLQKILPK